MNNYILRELSESAEVIADCTWLAPQIEQAAKLTINSLKSGGRLYLAGNGGSAALAQHLAAEFVGRYRLDRPALPAFCLSDNQAALTAIGNDYGYDQIFSRQAERSGDFDIFWIFTTSGKSKNVRLLLNTLYQRRSDIVIFTGEKAPRAINKYADITIRVPSTVTSQIQDAHQVIGHVLCGLIECGIFGEEA